MSDLLTFRRLQQWWAASVVLLVAIGATPLFVEHRSTTLPAALPAALVAASGAAALTAIVAMDRTLAAAAPEHDRTALRSYEVRQTLQCAVSTAPALLGSALAFAVGTLVAAVVGLGFGLLAMARSWPSRRRLERIEQAWRAAGHDVSALRAAESADGARR